MNKISFAIASAALGMIMPLNMAIAAQDLVPLPALTAEWWQWTALIPDVPDAPNPTSDARRKLYGGATRLHLVRGWRRCCRWWRNR
jgi:hypothetical protein